jgi:hypothetical protein
MSREKIVDRIRKLLALSRSSNENEAATAAARAAELMREHQIEEAQLRVEDPSAVKEPIERAAIDKATRRIRWKGTLAAALAKSLGCHMWWEGPTIKVLGRQSAARTMFYMYGYLVAEIDRLAEEQYRATGLALLPAGVVGWKNGFRRGAADTISIRLSSERHKHEASTAAQLAAGASTSAALMVIKKDQTEVDLAWKEMSKGFGSVSRGKVTNADGYRAGVDAGRNVSLGGGKGLGSAAGKLTNGGRS